MRRPVFLFLIAVILISIIRTELFGTTASAYEAYSGQVISLEGTAVNVKISEYYAQVTIRTKGEKVLVRIEGESDIKKLYSLQGRKISVTGLISVPSGVKNPGGFDYRRYLKSKNIFVICDTNIYKITGGKIDNPVKNLYAWIKSNFYMQLQKYANEDYFGICAGIIFGETFFLDDDYYKVFQKNGIAHILAVSGLHINFTYSIIEKILKKKNLKTDIFSVLLIFIYMGLSNYSHSVIRAGFMIFFNILSKYTLQRYDSLSSAALIAGISLLINPYVLFDAGFELSYVSCFAMALLSPWAKAKIAALADKTESRFIFKTGNAIIPGLCAFTATAPLIAYNYMSLSFISILINPAAIFTAQIILAAGLTFFLLINFCPVFLCDFISYICGRLISLPCFVLEKLNTAASEINKNTDVTAPTISMLLLFYCLVFFAFSEMRFTSLRRHKYRLLLCAEAFLTALALITPVAAGWTDSVIPWRRNIPAVCFLDVGQGDCIHIHSGNTDILIDGGGIYNSNIAEKTLKPYLLKNGIKSLDLAIVTHNDRDHSKGIYELNEIYSIEKIITNRDVYDVLSDDENDNCIISGINTEGVDFLFMADADMDKEKELLTNYPQLSCDVLKIAHHGSAKSSSEEFIQAVSPGFAVISVGKNNIYKHPSDRVIELLEKSDIMYARTDNCGAVYLKYADENCYIFENARKDTQWLIQRKSMPQD